MKQDENSKTGMRTFAIRSVPNKKPKMQTIMIKPMSPEDHESTFPKKADVAPIKYVVEVKSVEDTEEEVKKTISIPLFRLRPESESVSDEVEIGESVEAGEQDQIRVMRIIIKEMARICRKHGFEDIDSLPPEILFDEARAEDSPIHDYFEWDDK